MSGGVIAVVFEHLSPVYGGADPSKNRRSKVLEDVCPDCTGLVRGLFGVCQGNFSSLLPLQYCNHLAFHRLDCGDPALSLSRGGQGGALRLLLDQPASLAPP